MQKRGSLLAAVNRCEMTAADASAAIKLHIAQLNDEAES